SHELCSQLFVYGTLRRGVDNHFARILSDHATLIGPATMQGRLYAVDSFPGMILSQDPEERVKGEVYRLRNPSDTLPVLDGYEGCGPHYSPPYEFDRVLSVATLEDGRAMECWVYVYRGRPAEEKRIPSGDYLASLSAPLR
ncbi:MAG: gamma-glutamylcyclotransferase family protein, partial [Acidobacteriota bacterium]